MIDTTALLDAVSWFNEALKARAGVGLYPGQLQTIFDFSDGAERRRLLNDLAAMGGRGGELSQAAAEVLKVLEDRS